jgi:hypothetical protein
MYGVVYSIGCDCDRSYCFGFDALYAPCVSIGCSLESGQVLRGRSIVLNLLSLPGSYPRYLQFSLDVCHMQVSTWSLHQASQELICFQVLLSLT